MRNRVKCKKCESVIESYHLQDLVYCKCGEIGIDGGTSKYRCYYSDINNFVRVDDNDNEIIVKEETEKTEETPSKPNKEDVLKYLNDMISKFESLPDHAMSQPISHYDHLSLLILLKAILSS